MTDGERTSDSRTVRRYLDGFGNVVRIETLGTDDVEVDQTGVVLASKPRELETFQRFDEDGIYLVWSKNAEGHQTAYAYDELSDHVVLTVAADGTYEYRSYDRFGRHRRSESSGGGVEWFDYRTEIAGPRVTHRTSAGAEELSELDRRGDPVWASATDALGRSVNTSVVFDSSYREVGSRLPSFSSGEVRRSSLDVLGRAVWLDTPDHRQYLLHDPYHVQITDGMFHESHRFTGAGGNEIVLI
ncbi:MAG: hypothetical protein AAFY60_18520, partial [Myxococcota bacterium]